MTDSELQIVPENSKLCHRPTNPTLLILISSSRFSQKSSICQEEFGQVPTVNKFIEQSHSISLDTNAIRYFGVFSWQPSFLYLKQGRAAYSCRLYAHPAWFLHLREPFLVGLMKFSSKLPNHGVINLKKNPFFIENNFRLKFACCFHSIIPHALKICKT